MPSQLVLPSTFDPQPSTILVCEPAPYWTPELQRRFQRTGITVRGCRKWAELIELTKSRPHSVGVIELGSLAADCLTGLAREQRSFRLPPLVVISSPRFAELEWVLRDAGVAAFYPDLPASDDLAACCRRWLT